MTPRDANWFRWEALDWRRNRHLDDPRLTEN